MTSVSKEVLREHIRTFHLTGSGMDEDRPVGILHPTILDAVLKDIPALECSFPLYVAPGEPPRPLAEVLGESESTRSIVREVNAAMRDRVLVPVAELKESVVSTGCAIPCDGWLIGFHPQALLLLYGASLAAARLEARSGFFTRVKQCVVRLQDLLNVDDANRSRPSVESLSKSLGTAQFFAVSALEQIVGQRKGPRSVMSEGRRARCESTLATLEQALRDAESDPAFWLFYSGEVPPDLEVFHGRTCQTADSCAAALDFCDHQLGRFVEVLRAIRVARLEMESAFDPALHAELVERFDWQTAGVDELAALPAVVVMEPADRLARLSLTSFARLLRSGRPVQILVPCAGLYAEGLSGVIPDFGFLAIAHREAFVLESSLARWNHLAGGFAEMARTFRPAVAVVSIPTAGQTSSEMWLETTLCYLSRAFLLYSYDPARGSGWRERFSLFDPGGNRTGLMPLHPIALSPQFLEHFRVIPPSAWDDDQMEASEYLAKFVQTPPLAVPFLWVADAENNPQRAVFTREVANLCRDRELAWEMFAGFASTPMTKEVAADPGTEEAARQQGTAQAYDRVLALLNDPGLLRNGA